MILEKCKGVHCVDLGESFQTHIYLQNFVSIQPKTSPVKFAASRNLPHPAAFCARRVLEGDEPGGDVKARRPDAEEIRPPSWARAPASRRSGFAFGSQLEPLSFLQEEQHMLRLLRWKMRRRSVAALLIRRKQGFQLKHRRPAPSQKLLFEKLSGVRKLPTF